jgi:hypothetical protein
MIENRLLFSAIVLVVSYWLSSLIIPGQYVSSAMSGTLLVFGALAFIRYGREAYEVLFNGLRSERGDGSHMAVLGMALIAGGSVYVGGFGLLWVINERPDTWLGTASSSFGRAMMAVGFALMYLSPDIGRPNDRSPPYLWFLIILTAVALLSYAVGIYVAGQDAPFAMRG